jgi:hypothetical protein
MSMREQISIAAYNDLIEKWGKEPSWEDFKQAIKENKLQINKTIASEAFSKKGYIDEKIVILNGLLGWLAMLSTPIAVVLFFILKIHWIWIIISIFIGCFLMNKTRKGQCNALQKAAENNEKLYFYLLKAGAFYFKPIESCSND